MINFGVMYLIRELTEMEKKVMKAIEKCLDDELVNKEDIYSKVVEATNVPRPVVRRVARDLRMIYLEKIKILQG